MGIDVKVATPTGTSFYSASQVVWVGRKQQPRPTFLQIADKTLARSDLGQLVTKRRLQSNPDHLLTLQSHLRLQTYDNTTGDNERSELQHLTVASGAFAITYFQS